MTLTQGYQISLDYRELLNAHWMLSVWGTHKDKAIARHARTRYMKAHEAFKKAWGAL